MASTAHRAARRGLDFDDLQSSRHYRGMRAYSRSKLANILFTSELARRLSDTGVTANSLHPGTVASGFARDDDARGFLAFGVKVIKPFILTPEKGARTSVYLASSPEVAERHRAVFRQVPAPDPLAGGARPGRRHAPVVGQRGARRAGRRRARLTQRPGSDRSAGARHGPADEGAVDPYRGPSAPPANGGPSVSPQWRRARTDRHPSGRLPCRTQE